MKRRRRLCLVKLGSLVTDWLVTPTRQRGVQCNLRWLQQSLRLDAITKLLKTKRLIIEDQEEFNGKRRIETRTKSKVSRRPRGDEFESN